MAKTNVGIDLQLNENTGSKTPNIVRNLEQIGEAGQKAGNKLTGAFGPEAQQNFDRFSQKVDQLYQKQIQAQSKSGAQVPATTPGSAPQVAQGGAGSQLQQYMYGGQNVTRSATGIIESLGKGDVAGAGAESGGLISRLMKSVGGAKATALLGPAALVGGAASAGNAAVNQWEPHIESSKGLAASLGGISGTAEEQSKAIRDAFQMAAGAAEEFGKSAEHGAALMKSLTREGIGTEEAARRATTQAYAYANEYGVNAQSLTRAQGLQARFAPNRNILGLAGGGLAASGMNRGRYEEFLQGITSTMEAGLDQGVVRDPAAIAESLSRISAMGEQYTGARGAKLHQGMSQAFAGATGLGNESDMLMYRAAKGVVGKDGSYIDVMKQMEKGIGSGEMVQGLWEEIKGRTGDTTEQTELLRSTLGLNYTHSDNVRKHLEAGNWDKVLEISEKAGRAGGQTPDEQLLALQEKIKNDVTTIGQNLVDIKVGALKFAEGLTSDFTKGHQPFTEEQADAIAKDVKELNEKVGWGSGPKRNTSEDLQARANATVTGWSHNFLDRLGKESYGGQAMHTILQESTGDAKIRRLINKVDERREDLSDDRGNKKREENLLATAMDNLREAINKANEDGKEIYVESDAGYPNPGATR